MSEPISEQALALIAGLLANGAMLRRAWRLAGGISARMTAFECELPGGELRRAVVRVPGNERYTADREAAAHEFRVLEIVRRVGVAAAEPLLLDESGGILPDPYLVVEFIDGQVEHSPVDVAGFVNQVARELAAIHQIDGALPELAFLPRRDAWLIEAPREREAEADESLSPRRIRATLRAAWPLPHPNRPALLHGDPWPGNIVWREGRLMAMIDWEEACVGDPLLDLAIARFDVLTMLGRPAMEQLTHAYALARPQVALADLPCWDLYAALRPIGFVDVWAEGWRDLGRPDIDEAAMRAAHRYFVEQAFDVLAG
jgi:aminoglycoside phosphotransferase (APT) family kinase protein